MIPKIICYIFGHQRYEHLYMGMTEALDAFGRYIPLMEKKKLLFCSRCGAKL